MTVDKQRVGRAMSVTLDGLNARWVRVEARGDVNMTATRPRDAWIHAKERVRAALRNSGLAWPDSLMALAVHPPSAPIAAYDLALACATLAFTEPTLQSRLDNTAVLGELGLDGWVKRVDGLLPALLAARRAKLRRAIVPTVSFPEIPVMPGLEILGAERLADVAAWLRGDDERLDVLEPVDDRPAYAAPDFRDVVGQPEAAHALRVAAAGGHNLLMIGRPGAGVTLLARCLPGLLPALSDEQALEVARLHSLSPASARGSSQTPQFVAPHHTMSFPAFIGSGRPTARPGAITLAHHGVLFLEDVLEFSIAHLNAVRGALDSGWIGVSGHDDFPAQFQLVMATPPCPCREPDLTCTCSPQLIRRCLGQLPGLLLDRFDLRIWLRGRTEGEPDPGPASEDSATVRARVQEARDRAAARWGGPFTNASVPAEVFDRREFRLSRAVIGTLEAAANSGRLTKRGANGTLRVAWTYADLAGREHPEPADASDALALRNLRPLHERDA